MLLFHFFWSNDFYIFQFFNFFLIVLCFEYFIPLPIVESRIGISPLRSHRSVREPLSSYGSSCSNHKCTKYITDVPIPNAQITVGFHDTLSEAILLPLSYIVPFPILPISVTVHLTDTIHNGCDSSKIYSNNSLRP